MKDRVAAVLPSMNRLAVYSAESLLDNYWQRILIGTMDTELFS